jgi:hypothetical protein
MREEAYLKQLKAMSHLFRAFLRKHNPWLPFLGTMVVFVTFIVNDALREEATNLADSIDQARTSFATRMDIVAVMNHLDEDRRTIEEILNKVEGRTDALEAKKDRALWEISQDIEMEEPSYDRHVVIFANAVELLEKLPFDRQLDERRWSLRKRLDNLGKLVSDMKHRRLVLHYDGDGIEAQAIWTAIEADHHLIDGEDHADGLNTGAAIDKFAEMVLTRAQLIGSDADSKRKLWKHLSYGLYPLGLLLGLLGKVYGEKDPELEEA